MLLIGDVHANATYATKIIHKLREYIYSYYANEKAIIFLGDYVYHFSYHRQSMLELLYLFFELAQKGHHVYVLAGNHDRLGNTFVFAEAKAVLELLLHMENREKTIEIQEDTTQKKQTLTFANGGFVHFITTPEVHAIEGETILFVPYMIDDSWFMENANSGKQQKASDTDSRIKKIVNYIESVAKEFTNLLVMHHYYIANTQFPGQKAIFGESDNSLPSYILDIPHIRLISGHLHHPFVYRNYCCVGSIWHVSPLELDHYKCVRRYRDATLEPMYFQVNPYISIDLKKTGKREVTQEVLEEKFKEIHHYMEKSFCVEKSSKTQDGNSAQQSARNVLPPSPLFPTPGQCSLCIITEESAENTLQVISEEVKNSCHDIQIKKTHQSVALLVDKLTTQGKNLNTSFEDWKSLLLAYLKKKFPKMYEQYVAVLQELKLL